MIEGIEAFVATTNCGYAGTGITSVANRPLRQGWLLETKSSAASAHQTTLAGRSGELARMRG